jgi:hypothetical protein
MLHVLVNKIKLVTNGVVSVQNCAHGAEPNTGWFVPRSVLLAAAVEGSALREERQTSECVLRHEFGTRAARTSKNGRETTIIKRNVFGSIAVLIGI